MKTNRLLTTMFALAGLCLVTPVATAGVPGGEDAAQETPEPAVASQQVGEADENVESVQDEVEQKAEDLEKQRREKITQDAVDALKEATSALRLLEEDKHDDAVAALERSVGKLELVLRRDPDLALAPVDVSTVMYDTFLDREAMKDAIRRVERLIDRGRIQDARELLDLLRSEIVTSTSYLPMATFPDAIAEVAPLIDEGKYDEAKSLLSTTLNTVVVIDRTTALPVLRAQLLLDEAETLAEKSDRTDEESERLSTLLDSAEEQLRMADVLGYGDKGDFDPLYKDLKSIRKQTRGGGSGTGLFTTLRRGIDTIVEKVAG